ncbi:hypothetical protein C8T65DRAFT_697491 [Cerioporus squamosus]|nr:hypothetical protein C8T65DRAFT_697491 [Cerioporus squamosus]
MRIENLLSGPQGPRPNYIVDKRTGYWLPFIPEVHAETPHPLPGQVEPSGNSPTLHAALPAARPSRFKTHSADVATLADFYRKQSKNPSYEERKQLSRATGKPLDEIATWFKTKRHHDLVGKDTLPKNTRKKPTKFTEGQLKRLELAFQKNTRPDTGERYQLACELGVDCEAVKTWFENRRRRKQ